MTPSQKTGLGVVLTLLLSVNAYFVRDLVVTVQETYKAAIGDRAHLSQMAKELSEVKESVRGVQDLRVDVAVLKYSVSEMRASMSDARKRERKNEANN